MGLVTAHLSVMISKRMYSTWLGVNSVYLIHIGFDSSFTDILPLELIRAVTLVVGTVEGILAVS